MVHISFNVFVHFNAMLQFEACNPVIWYLEEKPAVLADIGSILSDIQCFITELFKLFEGNKISVQNYKQTVKHGNNVDAPI